MRHEDAPARRPARQTGERPDEGQVPASPTPTDDRVTPSSEATDDELLCTICGLRACWQ